CWDGDIATRFFQEFHGGEACRWPEQIDEAGDEKRGVCGLALKTLAGGFWNLRGGPFFPRGPGGRLVFFARGSGEGRKNGPALSTCRSFRFLRRRFFRQRPGGQLEPFIPVGGGAVN